jgi:hypothetical protein
MPGEDPVRAAPSRRRWRWVAPLSLSALALGATAPGFGNGFVQDDLPLILRNETVHTLARPATWFTQPYWHDPFPPALYRPLATAGLALQWVAGGGSPAVYRWVSAALLVGAAVALFDIAALILPLAAAWALAALFVVHPVHVEATALGVNQGELMVGLLLCWATATYIRARRGGRLRPEKTAALVLLFVAAALFKENGLVLPGLLLAAELTVIADDRPLRVRFQELRPLYLLLALAAAVMLAARSAVLRGDVVGTFTADAMAGSGLGGRALTMLGVVSRWARLLLWPAHLQADYGPNEIVTATEWGIAQWAGAAILSAGAATLLLARRRLPSLAFALGWVAVALIPVSNVLVPTGVALAERTLFLATAGAALAIGAILSLARSGGAPGARNPGRWGAAVVVIVLLSLGMLKSRSRDRVWHDQETLLRQTVLDAPRTYGAHLALARFLDDSGSAAGAELHYRQAAGENPALVDWERTVADGYRRAGLCRPAVRHYRLPLLIRPGDAALRAALVVCLLQLRRYGEVPVAAEPGVGDRVRGAFFRWAIRSADTAGNTPLPPH